MSARVAGIEAIRRVDQVRPGNQEVSTGRIVQDVQWLSQEKDPFGSWIPVEVRINFTDGTYIQRLASSTVYMIIQDGIGW